MGAKKQTVMSTIIFIVVAIIILFGALASIYADFLWFNALNYSELFLITLKSSIALGVITGLVFFIFAFLFGSRD